MELKSGDRFWNISDDKRPKLMSWLTINRACNLRCAWCYAKMTGYSKNSMTMDTARESVAFLKSLELDSAIIIGGEPTIHSNFFEIVRMIKNADLNAFLATNAIRLSDNNFLKKTLDVGISSITVSFKAANREMFLRDTGKDLFHLSVKAVQNIVKSGVHHVVNITACNSLMSNFDEMIETVKSTGTDKFSIDTGKPIFLNGRSCVDGMGTPREMANFFMKVYPKLEKSGLRFSVKVAVPFCLFSRDFIDKMIEDGNILTGCQMVSGKGLVIDPLGRVLPCNHLYNLFIGEVGKNLSSADEFWKFRKAGVMSEFYETVSAYPNEKCQNCPYWIMCGAGCKLYWLHYGVEDMMGNFEIV